MDLEKLRCAHNCRKSCAMLSEALRHETAMVAFYEKLKAECDYPDVHALIVDLAESRSRSVLGIVGKLNELRARADILDGVMSSYDPAGC